MNKRCFTILMIMFSLILIALPLFANGSKESADTEELRFAFMVHDLGNPFWATQAKGASDMASEFGVKLTIIDLHVDAAKEVDTWENLITSGVDGIIISCVDEKASEEYCKKAQAAGIKVMAAVHPLPGADASMSNDEYNYGYLEGVEAGKFIKNKLGGIAEFALLAADCTAFVIPRTDGIRDGILSEAPKAVLVSRQDAYQTDVGMSVTESILQAYPNLQVIACLNDNGALGAYEAMSAAGKDPATTWIGGTDGVDQALKLIKEGGMYKASVSMAPYESGRSEMDILYKLVNGGAVEAHQKIENVAITMDNVAEFIK